MSAHRYVKAWMQVLVSKVLHPQEASIGLMIDAMSRMAFLTITSCLDGRNSISALHQAVSQPFHSVKIDLVWHTQNSVSTKSISAYSAATLQFSCGGQLNSRPSGSNIFAAAQQYTPGFQWCRHTAYKSHSYSVCPVTAHFLCLLAHLFSNRWGTRGFSREVQCRSALQIYPSKAAMTVKQLVVSLMTRAIWEGIDTSLEPGLYLGCKSDWSKETQGIPTGVTTFSATFCT